jgi:FKBP-type peptidyl-prolyl cis-trans isomerase
MGTGLKRDGIDVDPDILGRAFKDAYTGGKSLMTEQEMKDVIIAVQRDMAAKQQEKRKQLAEKNKREGDAFLAENRKKEGVKVLPSGLQYKVLAEGTGKPPKASDKVTVNYRGTLIDGTEFDSSYKHGSPATFALNQVIKGWTEGLQLIKPAGKIQLFVPPDLGYGERGMGQQIGPNATLVFEVELIAVQPATE